MSDMYSPADLIRINPLGMRKLRQETILRWKTIIHQCKRCGVWLCNYALEFKWVKLCPTCLGEYNNSLRTNVDYPPYPIDNLCQSCNEHAFKLIPHHVSYVKLNHVLWICSSCHDKSVSLEFIDACKLITPDKNNSADQLVLSSVFEKNYLEYGSDISKYSK